MTADQEPVDLLRTLISIDSVNPSLVPGAVGEAEAAAFCADWLENHGFEVQLLEAETGRASVLALARGTGRGPSIMLNGHLDTVALSSYDGDGLMPRTREGNLYGRGAYDMKSGVAAIMVAAARAAAQPHAGDIVLALVADEEWASAGTEQVLEHITTDMAIVVEPSGLDLVTAHRGFIWIEVTVHGVAAHGSRPDLGVDAIAKSGAFLTAIDDLGRTLAAGPPHDVLGTGSVHTSTIIGGTEASSYPDHCTFVIERRTIPGENAQTVENELRERFDAIAADDPQVSYELAITAERSPFASPKDSATAAAVSAAYEKVTGTRPHIRGEAFWTDCALLGANGIDTVLIGVDGGGAHAASEWATLESLDTLTRTLEASIRLATDPARPSPR